jgi:cytochrome c553
MKKYLVLIVLMAVFSCAKKEEKVKQQNCSVDSSKTTKSRFVMYKTSEMAALMEQMYVDNQHLKERIKNGDTIGKFPNHFLQIHKAVMTDESDNDAFFKGQAAIFIKAQQLIYEDPKNAKEHFNAGVNACVQCHQQKCSGPIPRIKKLYIQ